jgi:hypothetical protein
MATCAICEQPITQSQRCAISDTEVMHRQCVRPNSRTVLQRARRDRDAALERVAILERERSERQVQVANERRESRAREQATTQELSDARAKIRRQALDNNRLRAENDDLNDLLNLLRAQSVAAAPPRAQRMADTPPPSVMVNSPTPPTPEDTRDATEIRMALLELDPS